MSEPKDDGGPAFPASRWERNPLDPRTSEMVEHDYPGMSLRDYFAGQALAGIFARESATFSGDMIALAAYAQADAMLRMRTKP